MSVALPEALEQAQAAPERSQLIIERFLRNREAIWQQIVQEYRLHDLIVQMVVSSTVALACYGVVIGMSHSVLQALASAFKLPVLFLLTLAICIPTLYVFNLLYGGQLSVRQALALILAATTVTSSLTLGFAPIALFILLTANNYYFYLLLNVVILTFTGFAGLKILLEGIHRVNALTKHTWAGSQKATGHMLLGGNNDVQAVNIRIFFLWSMLYGFVGTQLGWTLRPFFGNPTHAFVLFLPIEGDFWGGVAEALLWFLAHLYPQFFL